MQNNQAIFELLFNRNFSDPGNYSYLKEFSEAHPYFSPAQFFLLQKTKTGSTDFEKQVSKTNLFFNNPHWLRFQLNESKDIIATANQVKAKIEVIPTVKSSEDLKDELRVVITDDIESRDSIESNGENDHEIEPMKIELKLQNEKLNIDEAMLFEPMHVVDYFASQGIRLAEDAQTGDKLGKQLKSFTEWLKTMKKLHDEKKGEIPGEPDANIATLAENSNTQADVLTESMAEVFLKQGKAGKAGEIYRKLSLLNPAKSAYFAAKLENLKES